MKHSGLHVLAVVVALCVPYVPAFAMGKSADIAIHPHRALYDVTLTSIQSGGQLVDIRGKMYFEWKKTCESWTTDHRSSLMYEYSDGTSARINSDFASYETLDGKTLNFSSKRENNGAVFEEYRGHASLDKEGDAVYSIPTSLNIKLPENTFFPMQHTLEILKRAKKGDKFFNATLFDGSDDQGPQQVNVFIGGPISATETYKGNKKIDASLLRVPAHKMRLAFFDAKDDMSAAEYEMDLVALDNGVVSDIEIIYDNFTLKQHLVALEKMPLPACTEPSSYGGE